ncbi:MAG: hypothetical protein ACI9P5_003643 [Saprospiraceae bacterium]|jgi:uncharacterized protein (DUF1015 family)|tara:strand:+ start:138 stop:473 length:336 start_codon:yes stop_codon:yes gene_type:complete
MDYTTNVNIFNGFAKLSFHDHQLSVFIYFTVVKNNIFQMSELSWTIDFIIVITIKLNTVKSIIKQITMLKINRHFTRLIKVALIFLLLTIINWHSSFSQRFNLLAGAKIGY